jgi:hypothetical protein
LLCTSVALSRNLAHMCDSKKQKTVAQMLGNDVGNLDKLPKIVQVVRDKMKGEEINPETLKKFLSKMEFNNLANNYRNAMAPSVKEDYGKLSSDSDRRNWLAQHVLDPKTATCTGFSKTTAFNKTSNDLLAQWLHESQIAGPTYLNDATAAKLVCDSGELQERVSEFAALAAKGYKQFYFSIAMVKNSTGRNEESGVQAATELKDGEYSEVKDHIANSLGKAVSKKRPIVTKEPESEEKKRRREAMSSRNTAMRKCKALIDKATNEVRSIEIDIPKLKDKGYPAAMADWCAGKIDVMRTRIAVTQTVYNEEVVKVPSGTMSTVEFESDGKKLEVALQILEASFSLWKKEDANEVKKLIG